MTAALAFVLGAASSALLIAIPAILALATRRSPRLALGARAPSSPPPPREPAVSHVRAANDGDRDTEPGFIVPAEGCYCASLPAGESCDACLDAVGLGPRTQLPPVPQIKRAAKVGWLS